MSKGLKTAAIIVLCVLGCCIVAATAYSAVPHKSIDAKAVTAVTVWYGEDEYTLSSDEANAIISLFNTAQAWSKTYDLSESDSGVIINIEGKSPVYIDLTETKGELFVYRTVLFKATQYTLESNGLYEKLTTIIKEKAGVDNLSEESDLE